MQPMPQANAMNLKSRKIRPSWDICLGLPRLSRTSDG